MQESNELGDVDELTNEQLLAMLDLEDLTDEELVLLSQVKQEAGQARRCDEEAEKEVVEAIEGMRKRAKEEKQRVDSATESEYWCQIVFQSKAQRDAFFEELGKDLLDDQWVDGQRLAATLGIKLPEGPKLKSNRSKSWDGLVLESQQ